MARKKPAAKKAAKKAKVQRPQHVSSIALADDVLATLRLLREDASDQIGRAVSSSMLVRALVRFAGQQRLP